jgi:hypothetical protein
VTGPIEKFSYKFDVPACIPSGWCRAAADERFQKPDNGTLPDHEASLKALASIEADGFLGDAGEVKSVNERNTDLLQPEGDIAPDWGLFEYWLTSGQSQNLRSDGVLLGISALAQERLPAPQLRSPKVTRSAAIMLALVALVGLYSILRFSDLDVDFSTASKFAPIDSQSGAGPSSLPRSDAPSDTAQGRQPSIDSMKSVTSSVSSNSTSEFMAPVAPLDKKLPESSERTPAELSLVDPPTLTAGPPSPRGEFVEETTVVSSKRPRSSQLSLVAPEEESVPLSIAPSGKVIPGAMASAGCNGLETATFNRAGPASVADVTVNALNTRATPLACADSIAWAISVLGRAYTPTKQDETGSLQYFNALGNFETTNNIGPIYDNGSGLSRLVAEAMGFYKGAARGWIALALVNLKPVGYVGSGVPGDYDEAWPRSFAAASKTEIVEARGAAVDSRSEKLPLIAPLPRARPKVARPIISTARTEAPLFAPLWRFGYR